MNERYSIREKVFGLLISSRVKIKKVSLVMNKVKVFMKRTFAILLTLLLVGELKAQENPNFYLHENGVTVMCPDAEFGEKGEINGIIYTKREKYGEFDWITNENASTTCTSGITDMTRMFAQNETFNADISTWDVSNVKRFTMMFYLATSFNQDISKWDVSNADYMGSMFQSAYSFNQDISNWDMSNTRDISAMFHEAKSFNQDISNWDFSNARNLTNLFYKAERFNQDISDWNVSHVTSMWGMFEGALSFNQDLSYWCVTNVTEEPEKFGLNSKIINNPIWGKCPPKKINRISPKSDSSNIDLIPNFIWEEDFIATNYQIQLNEDNNSIVIDTTILLETSYKSTVRLDPNSIYSWRIRGYNVHDEVYGKWSEFWEFRTQPIYLDKDGIVRCKEIPIGTVGLIEGEIFEVVDRELLIQRRNEGADLSKTCVSNVKDMSDLFANTSFNEDISYWDVSNVTDMSSLFKNSVFEQDLSIWDVSNVITMHSMFENSVFNSKISDWDVSNVSNMAFMFSNSAFNQEIGEWNVGNVTNMNGMFKNSSFDKDIKYWDVSSTNNMKEMFKGSDFNQFIGVWNVSNVEDMSGLFQKTTYNQDLGSWDVSKVKNMLGMFAENNAFNQNINSWNVSSVDTMAYMFFQSSAFNQDLGSWDVREVEDMSNMFYLSGFNKELASWDVSNVVSMKNMFYSSPFNQDISSWCVILIKEEPTNFSSNTPLAESYKPFWGSCPAKTPKRIVLSTPNDSASNISTSPIFSWGKDSLATHYQLQIFNIQSNIVGDRLIQKTNLNYDSVLVYDEFYKWRVRGINSELDLKGEWSEVWSFTTINTPLSSPSLSTPFNEQVNVGTLTEFSWNKVESSVSYHLQVSSDEIFSATVFDSSKIGSTSFTLTEPLSENTTYFWRMKSISDNELRNSEWSDTLTFTTGVRTSTEDVLLPQEYTLSQNYPNPFNPSTQIQYALPEATQVTLEVFNSVGQKVMELVNGQQSAGYHTATFDASGLSSGVYLYKLTTPSFTQTKKMLLIK